MERKEKLIENGYDEGETIAIFVLRDIQSSAAGIDLLLGLKYLLFLMWYYGIYYIGVAEMQQWAGRKTRVHQTAGKTPAILFLRGFGYE